MSKLSSKALNLGLAVTLFACGLPATAASPAECGRIAADIARGFEAKQAAVEKRENAHKTPLPVAIPARISSANDAIEAAQTRLDTLHSTYFSLGCARGA